jgi:hypothetical protein
MQTGAAGCELIQGHQVVHQPEISTLHFVPVGGSNLCFKIKYLLRLSFGVVDSSKCEGCRYVRQILRADLGVLVEPVILLIG